MTVLSSKQAYFDPELDAKCVITGARSKAKERERDGKEKGEEKWKKTERGRELGDREKVRNGKRKEMRGKDG